MKYILMVLPLLISGYLKAQSISAITNNGGLAGMVSNIHFEFNLGESFGTTVGSNTIITQGLLQPMSVAQGSLPVTGLQFTARRSSENKVQLNWKTVHEMNNTGFYVERKRENDNDFVAMGFVMTKAVNGNSNLPLQYEVTDTNNYKGITYYRLKQTDADGKFSYSIVCAVNGTTSRIVMMKAWPIPSQGDFNVMVEGIDRETLLLFDATGRMLKQMPVTNGTPVKISGIRPGTYILKLAGNRELVQMVLVQ